MFRVSTTRQSRRIVAVAVVCSAISTGLTGTAIAADGYPPKIGDTPADFGKSATVYTPKAGDTPADFGKSAKVYAPKVGDTPADFGKSVATPSLVEIVRPERTIVRDTDPALPIVMSALALLVALGLAAQTAMQGRGLRTRAR